MTGALFGLGVVTFCQTACLIAISLRRVGRGLRRMMGLGAGVGRGSGAINIWAHGGGAPLDPELGAVPPVSHGDA